MKQTIAGINRREFLKKAGLGSVVLASLPALGQALATAAEASGPAEFVRWDIVSVNVPVISPPTIIISAGGVAFAMADANLKIKLTGHGTFISPASGGTSGAVTGGGTWETFNGATSTGSGTYRVTGLASWQFANMQSPILQDLIGNINQRANGNAILRVDYSDGKQGTLGIGCHGPGAPAGIQEGVIATKGYFTYWTAPPPLPAVDANRTLFHLMRG